MKMGGKKGDKDDSSDKSHVCVRNHRANGEEVLNKKKKCGVMERVGSSD